MRKKLIAISLAFFGAGLASGGALGEPVVSQHGATGKSGGAPAPALAATPGALGPSHRGGFAGSAFSNGWADDDFFAPRQIKPQTRGARRGVSGGFGGDTHCQAVWRVSRCPIRTARPWKK